MVAFRLRYTGLAPEIAPPYVVSPPTLVSANPGVFQVGIEITATPPVAGPDTATVSAPTWKYGDDGATISGASGSTYTPVVGDVGETIYVEYTITKDGVSITSQSEVTSAVQAASGNAPAVANQTLNFGRNSRIGHYSEVITNTGGTIDRDCAITSGNEAGHWQIDATTGVISPAVNGGLDASYTLGITVANANGSDTATITMTGEANAYDAATTTQVRDLLGEVQIGGTITTAGVLGAVSTATKVYLKGGVTYTLSGLWFNNRAHTAVLTIQSRVPWYSGDPAVFDTTGVDGAAWQNIKFKDLQINARFLRETMGNLNYIINLYQGVWKLFHLEDCRVSGDCVDLGPGQHFRGLIGVRNTAALDLREFDFRFTGSEPISSGNQLKARLHGLWRLINAGGAPQPLQPGLNVQVEGVDMYDIGVDGVVVANNWTSVNVSGNYFHSPYIDIKRVLFDDAADDVFVRNTAWTGAADGKKLFMVWAGQFVSTAGSADCLYQQGAVGSERVKLYRTNAGNIECIVKNAAGSTIATLTSSSTYSGGSYMLVVAVSVDTDRNAQMYIWKEQNGGGGSWTSAATASTSGQSIALNSAPVSLAGTPSKTEKFEGYYRRHFVWYGQAPDLSDSAVRALIMGDAAPAVVPAASLLTTPYGTPVLQQEGDTAYWNSLSSAVGTGDDWDDVGLVELDHGDFIQTQYSTTVGVTGTHVFDDNIMMSDVDLSATYTRSTDPSGLLTYRSMQGLFKEDQNSGNYQTVSVRRNVIVIANTHGISPYNGKNCTITDNVLIVPPEWGYTTSSAPTIRVLFDGTSPDTGGNTITNNFAWTASSVGSGNTVSGNTTGVAPASYGSYMTAGSFVATRAGIVAYVAGAV